MIRRGRFTVFCYVITGVDYENLHPPPMTSEQELGQYDERSEFSVEVCLCEILIDKEKRYQKVEELVHELQGIKN